MDQTPWNTRKKPNSISHILSEKLNQIIKSTCQHINMLPVATDAFTVQGHMHLRIIIYLLEFLLCLIQVTLLFHHIRKQRWQMRQSTSNDYKTQGKPLPSQQSAFLHTQWMPPRPPTLPITSQPSMEGNNSWKSTATYLISSIISHTYDSTLPPPSHRVCFTPTATNAMRSSRSSKKSTSTSKPSSSLSTALTRTMGKSSSSTRNQRSSTHRTGEHSHGDHSWTGNSRNCQTRHQQMRNDSSSQTATGSTRAHGTPAKSSKRVCLSTSDFFFDESWDIEDTYGDGTDDVYNNIN